MRALENSVLFDAGDPSSCAYLVVDGVVRVESCLLYTSDAADE